MSANVVPPVASLLKSIESGIKLAKRTARSADLASREQARVIFDSSRTLQSSLEASAKAIVGAYEESSEICGRESFSRALLEDRKLCLFRFFYFFPPNVGANSPGETIQAQLKDLRIKLFDQIDPCLDFDENSFEVEAFANLDKEVQQCRDSCIQTFYRLRDNHFQRSLQNFRRPAQGRQDDTPQPETKAFPFSPDDIGVRAKVPEIPRQSPWVVESPSQYGSDGSTQWRQRPSFEVSPISPHSMPNEVEEIGPWIPKEIVHSRLTENEQFLERRRHSRALFQNELRQSIGSIETRNSEVSTSTTDSRLSRSSSSTYDSLVTRQRSQGQYSHATRSSVASHDRHSKRPGSQELSSPLRSLPVSPAVERRTSDNIGSWGSSGVSLSSTLRVPGFGAGIESGLEVVTNVDHDNEKMLVEEEPALIRPNPPASTKSVENPIVHDASFYRLGGFCEGATMMSRGQTGFKVVKKPSVCILSVFEGRILTKSAGCLWLD